LNKNKIYESLIPHMVSKNMARLVGQKAQESKTLSGKQIVSTDATAAPARLLQPINNFSDNNKDHCEKKIIQKKDEADEEVKIRRENPDITSHPLINDKETRVLDSRLNHQNGSDTVDSAGIEGIKKSVCGPQILTVTSRQQLLDKMAELQIGADGSEMYVIILPKYKHVTAALNNLI